MDEIDSLFSFILIFLAVILFVIGYDVWNVIGIEQEYQYTEEFIIEDMIERHWTTTGYIIIGKIIMPITEYYHEYKLIFGGEELELSKSEYETYKVGETIYVEYYTVTARNGKVYWKMKVK